MERHIKILESCGIKFDQQVPNEPDQTMNLKTQQLKQVKSSEISQKGNDNDIKNGGLEMEKEKNISLGLNTKK